MAPFVSYAEEIVKQVVLVGLVDQEIKKDVLGTTGINDKSLAETLGLIEDKEAAARSTTGASASGHITSYKRIAADDRRLKGTGKCEKCAETFNNKRVVSGRGKKDDTVSTFKLCKSCWQKDRPPSRNETHQKAKATDKKEKADESAAAEVAGQFDFFGASTTTRRRKRGRRPEFMVSAATTEMIEAMVYYSTRGWVTRHPDHGRVKLSAYTTAEDAKKFGITHREVRPTNVSGVADSGCQACIMGTTQLYKMGLQKSDLCRIKSSSTSINGTSLNVLGVVVLRLAGMDPASGKIVETAAQVRVAEGVKDLFLSKSVMIALGIIPPDFPRIKAAGTEETDSNGGKTCPGGCKPRGPPPGRPKSLPFPPTEANVPDMKAWLLDRFAGSTFNRCSHQPLPMMDCVPLRLHIDPDAEPVAAYNARPVSYTHLTLPTNREV